MLLFCTKLRRSVASAILLGGLVGAPAAIANAELLLNVRVAVDAPAMQAVLARGDKVDPAIVSFYASRGNKPFWLDKNLGWTQALISSLREAYRHGLPVDRYGPDELLSRARAANSAIEQARVELDMMQAYVKFGRDVSTGILEPRSVSKNIHVYPQRRSTAQLISHLSGPAKPNFDGLAPSGPDYEGLKKELIALSARATVSAPLVPAGRTLRPGKRSSRVVALRERLDALEALSQARPEPTIIGAADTGVTVEPVGDPSVYDAALVQRVRAFQELAGLKPDGIVGPQTLAAINATSSDRYGQVLVNMERARWMNRDLGQRHIRVNLADFTMELVQNGQVRLTSRVVVGKAAKHQTPEFSDEMTHMVVNPTWHVPTSIATKEILPRLKRDPNYARNRGMRLIPTGGRNVPDGITSDYSQFSQGYFPFRIKQRPSKSNALGRVKFMFPNQFAIYLHDTPAKRLFNRETRAFSHGCVRVQKPFELAHALLEGQEENPEARFNAWMKRGKERRVNLDRTVQVHLMYRTAWTDAEGTVQFRNDIYGRDRLVLRALKNAGVEHRV